MFLDMMFAEEKIRQLRGQRIAAEVKRRAADPDAEIPPTGAGLVHEVFRRIAEGEQPERPRRRWIFASG